MARAASLLPPASWGIEFRRRSGAREAIEPGEVAKLVVADLAPVRSPTRYADQKNRPCSYWSSTAGRHLRCESQLERAIAQLLDLSPSVVEIAAQPFSLRCRKRGAMPAPD